MEKYISLDAVLAEIEKIIADETESIKCFERRRNVSEVQRSNARIGVLTHLRSRLNTLEVKEVNSEKEQVASVWHDASEEPKDMSHCLICYKAGDKVTYMDIIPVLYNKDTKEFVSHSYPHTTDSKIEYGSIEGHGLVDVYKNMRDRFPLADIDKWAYIVDVLSVAVGSKKPVSERFAFKAIPRLLEMIEPTDRAKVYTAKLADALKVEGYSTDAKIVMESIKVMNGKKVPMATMDDKPINEDLEESAIQFATDTETGKVDVVKQSSFFWGAIYHKQQMMANAVDVTIAIPHQNGDGGYTQLLDSKEALPFGDKVKVIVIKEN